MTSQAVAYRLLIIDDNEAIHEDLKKILLPPKIDSQLVADEALLFGATPETGVVFEIDSAHQGQEGLECVQKAQASGRASRMGRSGDDRAPVEDRPRLANRHLHRAL
jgi:CheY-like chemotaxis protein